MYISSTEVLKKDLSIRVRMSIFNVFQDSLQVYKELLKDDVFQGEYADNITTRLLNYTINRGFSIGLLPENLGVKVNQSTMAFNQKRIEINTENMILTIAKSHERNVLPCVSSYKKEFAKANSKFKRQLIFDVDRTPHLVKEMPYYGIITYKVDNGEFDFVDIMIPDSNYKEIIDRVELKSNIVLVKNYKEETEEERIISRSNLKKKIQEDLIKNSEGI